MVDRLFTRTFVLVSIANFTAGMTWALFLHFPRFLADLGASDAQIGLIFGTMALSAIAIRPLLGTAMDRYGRRPVILVGNVLNTVFVLLYLTVGAIGPWIYAVRIGHGIGEAMLFSAYFTYAADVVPATRRTEGIAIFGVSGLLPIAVAGILGDFILSVAGPDELFISAAVFSGATLLLSFWLPEVRPEAVHGRRRVGFWSVVARRELLSIWWMVGAFSVALAGYFVFIRRFVDDTGLGSVSLFFSTYIGVAVAERLFLGRLPDRVGRSRVLYPSMAFIAAGFFLLAGAGSWVAVAVAGALCGAGHGFAFPILAAMLVDRAPEEARGSAMAFFTALVDAGTLIGGPALGAIVDASGWGTMFTVSGVALILATLAYAPLDGWATRGDVSRPVSAGG